MKRLLLLCSAVLLLAACTQENFPAPDYLTRSNGGGDIEGTDEPTDRIILGNRLANPYTVSNMQTAVNLLRQQNPSLVVMLPLQIIPSHYYVKFKPRTEEELALLEQDSTLILFDYPLDYEIEEGGTYYHDPELPDSVPTYQYTAVDHFKWAAMNNAGLTVPYEVLEELYIPEQDSSLDEMIDGVGTYALGELSPLEEAINALVDKALEITGNNEEAVGENLTRSSNKWTPSGTIQVYDDIVDGLIPLQNIEVRARRWFIFYRGTTDSEGNFVCNGSFRRAANYSIKWESNRFDIREGIYGQAMYNGPKQIGPWNLQITDGKSLRFATIYRAANRYYYGSRGGLSRPTNAIKLKISYINRAPIVQEITGDYWTQVPSILGFPTIRIFGRSSQDNSWHEMSEIYSTTSHEIAHAAHYTNAFTNFTLCGKRVRESWACCVQYYLTRLEYQSLGVNYLCLTKTITTPASGDLPAITRIMEEPDFQYNFQAYYDIESDYTPLFIDLIDSYDQNYFHEHLPYYNVHQADFVHDYIQNVSLTKIEEFVFSSDGYNTIRQKLLDYIPESRKAILMYGHTDANINILFDFYEE